MDMPMAARRIEWLVLAGVLSAALRCDCNDYGGPLRISAGDVPLHMTGMTCGLLEACCSRSITRNECLALEDRAVAWGARAQQLGLHADEGCPVRLYFSGQDCGMLEQHERYYWACDQTCALFYGSAELGEPCELVGLHMSTCAKSLVCGPDERCHLPCELPELALAGQRCGTALGLPAVRCDAGLACTAAGYCASAALLGAPCSAELPCDAEGWCGPSEQCEPRRADGEVCEVHEQCSSSLCSEGICVAPTLPFCVDPAM
jgi:hypothetical protein